jgi:hypothetical protein
VLLRRMGADSNRKEGGMAAGEAAETAWP